MLIKSHVLWNVTLCRLVNTRGRFVGVFYIHIQGQAFQAVSICAVAVEETDTLDLFWSVLKILKRLCNREWAYAPFALDLPGNAVTKFTYFGSFVSDFLGAVYV